MQTKKLWFAFKSFFDKIRIQPDVVKYVMCHEVTVFSVFRKFVIDFGISEDEIPFFSE